MVFYMVAAARNPQDGSSRQVNVLKIASLLITSPTLRSSDSVQYVFLHEKAFVERLQSEHQQHSTIPFAYKECYTARILRLSNAIFVVFLLQQFISL